MTHCYFCKQKTFLLKKNGKSDFKCIQCNVEFAFDKDDCKDLFQIKITNSPKRIYYNFFMKTLSLQYYIYEEAFIKDYNFDIQSFKIDNFDKFYDNILKCKVIT